MIDMWETTYWSEHVPNDAVPELLALVRLCSDIYKLMVDHLMPDNWAPMVTTDGYTVEIKEAPLQTYVYINNKGGTVW